MECHCGSPSCMCDGSCNCTPGKCRCLYCDPIARQQKSDQASCADSLECCHVKSSESVLSKASPGFRGSGKTYLSGSPMKENGGSKGGLSGNNVQKNGPGNAELSRNGYVKEE